MCGSSGQRWTGVPKPARDSVPSSSHGLRSTQALPESADPSDRVRGERSRIFIGDGDAQKAETIEAEEPKRSGPLSTRPGGVQTPLLVVVSNPAATSHPGAAGTAVCARVCNCGGRAGGGGLVSDLGFWGFPAARPSPRVQPQLRQLSPLLRQDRGGQAGGGMARPCPRPRPLKRLFAHM